MGHKGRKTSLEHCPAQLFRLNTFEISGFQGHLSGALTFLGGGGGGASNAKNEWFEGYIIYCHISHAVFLT